MSGFAVGDPRARAAGRKGGRVMRHKQTPDYIAGYRAGARTTIRRMETTMERLSHSPFIRACIRLHREQRAADTPDARESAGEALSHLLRMSHAGRFDEWLASHPESSDVDDSMAANLEDRA